MPTKNNFWKSLLGERAEVLVSKAVAYTDSTTYAAFVTDAVEGELGVFNADTLAAFDGAGSAGTARVFIALKRDGQVEKSVAFKVANVTAARTAYEAPVKQVTKVTNSGAIAASLAVADITYTAKATGTEGNAITIVYVDSASNNVALSIAVSGTAITVNLATDGASAPTSTATLIKAAIEASAPAAALVTATITGTAATVQAAHSVASLAGGTAPTAPTAKKFLGVKILETTPGYQPFPTYAWNVQTQNGESYDAAMARLATAINDTASVANKDRDLIISASYSASTNELTLTALDFGVTFRVQLTGELYDTFGTVVYTTTAKLGSGFPTQVKLFQDAGDIYKGVTTQYPLQGATAADFGQPTDFVDSTLTYNIYTFPGYRDEVSKTVHKKQYFTHNIIVIVPSTGTSPEAQVKLIFGL